MTLSDLQDILKNKLDIYEDLLLKTKVNEDIKYNVKIILSERTEKGCLLKVKNDYSPFQFAQFIEYDYDNIEDIKTFIYTSVKQMFEITETLDSVENGGANSEDEECY